MTAALLFSTFIVAACGLVYELLAGTAASYLLGDSITQFSTVIGTYLFAMGVGSYLARYVRNATARFIQIEVLVGLLGGCSSSVLFLLFQRVESFRVVLYGLVGLIGVLVGMEIPLVLRILKDRLEFRDLVSQVLSVDYLGALAASVLFPLWLVPRLGLVRGAMLFGMANVAVGLAGTWLFPLPAVRRLRVEALVALLLLGTGFVMADRILGLADEVTYQDEVIHSRSTEYQRIVITRGGDELRLYLNGHLQFGSRDEHRYHESLVHPGLRAVDRPRRVLILGGGDGLAAREILRDTRVEQVVLVDLDPGVTSLFQHHPLLASLNAGSLSSPRLQVVNRDAFRWIEEEPGLFDFIVLDFPDPSNHSLGKLYTTAFYRRLHQRLAPGGIAVLQATSPLFARRSYWCIVETVRSVGFQAAPYHAYVPSFGEWGFVIASHEPYRQPRELPPDLRFLTPQVLPGLFEFPADMGPVEVEVNRLDNQVLVNYYDSEWRALGP